MKFTLKKGQTLADVFPEEKWAQLFPASQSATSGKRLDARKFVGILKRDCDPLEIQRQMRNEWD